MEYRSAAEQVAALAKGEVSAAELCDLAVARIEALDPRLNAVVLRDFERAREAAKAADAALARGERRALLGLPMTVKEQFAVAGLPTSWGDPKHRDWRPEADALAVSRLKAAGAVILGKTNVAAMLSDWQSTNEVYGTTNNPWDVGRTPGGSSGGSAAALAAGFVALELGSDIGGSLRAPAHFCGVTAHKPSLDLVPLRGGEPPGVPAIARRGELSVAGPMARTAGDLALGLEVLAGPDELLEGIGYRLALPPPRHAALRDYRVLVVDEHPLLPTAANVRRALDELAGRLERAGCAVARGSSALPDLARTTQVYVLLLSAFLAADLPEKAVAAAEKAARELAPDDRSLQAMRLRGGALSHRDWLAASRSRDALRHRWQALFAEFDVMLCPAMPTVAFPHDHSPQRTRVIEIDGAPHAYRDQLAWIAPATLTGFPATAAPIGLSPEGLPVGVQIVGGYLDDRTTIDFAGHLEREFGGFRAPRDLG